MKKNHLPAQSKKRIAIQFFGHLRTFRETYQSFKKNIIDTHKRSGYEIDVFMHTWDELEVAEGNWSHTNASIRGKKLSESDLDFIKSHYNPIQITVEKMTVEHGLRVSVESVDKLRRSYEKTTVTTYDWVIMTRSDIFFDKPFLIDDYLKPYLDTGPLLQVGLPNDAIFVGHNAFAWMNVVDPRAICEPDLVWFARPTVILNCFHNWKCKTFGENKMVLLDYILDRDFYILRSEYKYSRCFRRFRFFMRFILKLLPLPSQKVIHKLWKKFY